MKTYMPLDGFRWSCDSDSALCDIPQTNVLGQAGGVICRKTDSYVILLKTNAKISAMNEKLFEDDSQWMLFAIVVIMALMGYGIYIIWSWLKDEDEKDGDGNPTDKEESVFADFNYCRRNSFRPFSFRGRIGRGQLFVTFLALYGFWLVILIVKELFCQMEWTMYTEGSW